MYIIGRAGVRRLGRGWNEVPRSSPCVRVEESKPAPENRMILAVIGKVKSWYPGLMRVSIKTAGNATTCFTHSSVIQNHFVHETAQFRPYRRLIRI
jgi:hypothetical protein